MAELKNVYCTYTGGGIYIVTAQYGDVYLASDLQTYGSYDVPYDDIEEKYDHDYDGHWKDSPVPYPTWAELFDAIKKSHESGRSPNLDLSEVKADLEACHPVMNQPMNLPDQQTSPDLESNERIQMVGEFIEIFEDFLNEKGIQIPNDEKDEDPFASNIYGTDYGNLESRIEQLLINIGALKGE